MFKKIIFIIVLFTSLSQAYINLEPPVIGEKEGLETEVALGAIYNSGNTDSIAANFSAKGQYDQKTWLTYLIANYAYGESNELRDNNNGLLHLRYVHEIADTPYDYEFFVQTEFDEFQAIHSRNLAGANIRRDFSSDFFDKLYIGLGFFYSYMEPDSVTELDPIYERVKMNSYISLLKKVNEHFSVTYLGYYQPNVEDFSDYRIFQVLQLTTDITDNTALSFDILHKFNETPYHNVEKTDIRSTISLKYKFK